MEMRRAHMIAAVISALGVFSAASSSTSATIIYSGLQDLTIAHDSDERFIFVFAEAPGAFNVRDSRGEFRAASEQGELYSTVPRVDRYIPAFEVGEAIHSGLEWVGSLGGSLAVYNTASNYFGKGYFFDRSDGYLPIRTAFNDNEYFGWLRISHSMDDERLTIHDWAWNSRSGEPILAGEIPEPATYAILVALGSLGFVIVRRRRRSGRL